MIEIDFHILRRAAGGDDVESAIGVEISETKVFAGHRVVVHHDLLPFRTLVVERDEELDADFVAGLVAAPTSDDLIGAQPKQIGRALCRERV